MPVIPVETLRHTMKKDVKVRFLREDLWRALKILAISSPVPAKKSIHRFSKLVKIVLDPAGHAKMSTASMVSHTIYSDCWFECEGESFIGNLTFTTVFDKLYSIVQGTSCEAVLIKVDKQMRWVKVKCEGIAKLPQEDAETFPFPPDLPVESGTQIPIGDVLAGIEKVKDTICEDSSYSSIFGIFFDGNWVSTTGRYLTVHPSSVTSENSAFIAREFINLAAPLQELWEADNSLTVQFALFGENSLQVVFPKVVHYIALQGAAFPNYREIVDNIKAKAVHSCKFNVPALREAFARIAPFIDVWGSLKINITSDKLRLEADNKDASENYTETIAHEGSDADLEVLLRFEFLQKLVIDNDNLTLFFENGSNPLYTIGGETVTILPPMRRT